MKIKQNGVTLHISKKTLIAAALAIFAGTAVAAPAGIPPVGEYWAGQGGINAGWIMARDGQPGYFLIVGVEEISKGQWGNNGTEIKGAKSHWDGRANTEDMIAAGCDLGVKAKAYTADGHTDFYLPASGELHLCRANQDKHWKNEWYWSSTQYSGLYAWAQHFAFGSSSSIVKFDECRARAVRRVYL